MLIFENIGLALAGLSANKMRSFLTMLGILIGIASVIAIIMVGDSMNESVMSSMGDLGANQISVSVRLREESYDSDMENQYKMKKKDYMTPKMINDVKFRFQEDIEMIATDQTVGDVKVKDGNRYANVSIRGGNQGYIKSKNLEMLEGAYFKEQDQEDAKKVVLVSDKLVYNVFQGDAASAVGKTIELVLNGNYHQFTIMGVYRYVPSAYDFQNVSEKNIRTECYIPLITAMRVKNLEEQYSNYKVLIKKGADSPKLADNIQTFLNKNYYSQNTKVKVEAYSMESTLKEMSNMMKSIKLAIAGIGAISLLVGGIGVMNIMIVSITERTREIGTRKALGASNQSIRIQFIVEAIVICLIGGLMGVLTGIMIGNIVTKLMGYTGKISPGAILFCVMFSGAFGVFFGYYPANRAAKMDPIEALRYE